MLFMKEATRECLNVFQVNQKLIRLLSNWKVVSAILVFFPPFWQITGGTARTGGGRYHSFNPKTFSFSFPSQTPTTFTTTAAAFVPTARLPACPPPVYHTETGSTTR